MFGLRQASFTLKFLFIAVCLIVLTNCIQLYRAHTALSSTNGYVVEQSAQGLRMEAESRIQAAAQELAGKSAGYLEGAYQTPAFMVRQLTESISADYAHRLSRRQVEIMTRTALAANPLISSIYVDFEADAFDGSDDLYRQGYQHSVPGSGVFSLYFVRENGKVKQLSSDLDSNALRYSEQLNASGFREGEWYLCPMETGQACLLEPYPYEDSAGQPTYMTSLTLPILVDGEFLGVVGVDINLPRLQGLTEQLSQQMYQGKTRITLLSRTGLILGSSHHPDKVASAFSAVELNQARFVEEHRGESLIEEQEESLLLLQPVHISGMSASWMLVLDVPKAEIYAVANQMRQEVAAIQARSTRDNLVLGASITLLGGLLIGLLVRSAARPFRQVNEKLEMLSGPKGSLGMMLEVETHREFIRMAELVNRLVTKLRNMVLALLEVNHNVTGGTEKVGAEMDRINAQLGDQRANLDAVASAMQQMSSTGSELAGNAERAAAKSQDVKEVVTGSRQAADSAQQQLDLLSQDIRHTHERFNRVAQQSMDIDRILDVIINVSEQTNLLALNAAIEASRAGESGRGFAVVADEVRALAHKTRHSVDEIGSNIQALVSEIEVTSRMMQGSFDKVQQVQQLTGNAYRSMDETVNGVVIVVDELSQIASAIEEQSMVSQEINSNLADIAGSARQLDDSAAVVRSLCSRLQTETEKQSNLLSELEV